MRETVLSVSIQAFDQLNLASNIDKLISSGINSIHVDVMDYNHAGNFAYGPDVIRSIKNKYKNKLKLNIHFMIKTPTLAIKSIINEFRPYMVINDIESLTLKEHHEVLEYGQNYQVKMGVAIQVNSNLVKWKEIMNKSDIIMLMSVPIGMAGQPFDKKVYKNSEWVNKNIDMKEKDLGIDGGVRLNNIAQIYQHKFNFIVLGSAYKNVENFSVVTQKFNRKNFLIKDLEDRNK